MYQKTRLKNGLSVITAAMPHMESVSVGIWIGVGGRFEDRRLCGMSHVLEHMLFKGTSRYSANALKEAIEGVGGSFNGFTGEEVTCYLVKLPFSHIELGLGILSDMVLNPTLSPVELEKEKYVICEEIKMYMDQPSHHVFDILSEAMWPDHPLGRSIAGYAQTVKNFKRDDLIEFKKRYYQPANISVVISGKIGGRDKSLAYLKDVFSAPSLKKRFSYRPAGSVRKSRHVTLFNKDTKQTHLAFGFHGMARPHKLKYAVSLLNIILGGNMSSRLFERLREKKPLCYEIGSSVKRYKETSVFFIHAGVDNKNAPEASSEILRELVSLKKDFVTPDELRRAKEYAKGQILLALEDTATRMLWLGERIMQDGRAPSVREMLSGIDGVTIGGIKNTAKAIFVKDHLNFAAIGPLKSDMKKKLNRILTL